MFFSFLHLILLLPLFFLFDGDTDGRPAGAAVEVRGVQGGRQPRAGGIAVQPDEVLDPIGGGFCQVVQCTLFERGPC